MPEETLLVNIGNVTVPLQVFREENGTYRVLQGLANNPTREVGIVSVRDNPTGYLNSAIVAFTGAVQQLPAIPVGVTQAGIAVEAATGEGVRIEFAAKDPSVNGIYKPTGDEFAIVTRVDLEGFCFKRIGSGAGRLIVFYYG